MVTLDADGLTVETEFIRTECRWAGVTEVYTDDGYLIVVFPGPAEFAIPADVFRDDNDFGRVAEQIRGWVTAAGGSVSLDGA